MQKIRKILETAQSVLGKAGIDYALIGGLALAGHGVHRATFDVDLLIDGQYKAIAKQALQAEGFELVSETDEVLQFQREGALDLLLANRSPTQDMLKRATLLPALNIKCVSAEDIIGLKIQAYMNNPKRILQDKADIAALISSNDEMDWARIKSYADMFDQWPEIEALRKPK